MKCRPERRLVERRTRPRTRRRRGRRPARRCVAGRPGRLGHAGCHCRERSTGVGAQPQAQRLERHHFLDRDVGEVDVGAERADQPRLLVLAGRLEQDPVDPAAAHRGGHDLLADRPVLAVDPDRPALPALGDDPAGTGGEVAGHLAGPLLGGEDLVGILAPHLGQHDESLCAARRSRSCLSSSVMGATPRETSTLSNPTAAAQSRHSCARPWAQEISSSVPPRQERTPWPLSSASFSGSPASR